MCGISQQLKCAVNSDNGSNKRILEKQALIIDKYLARWRVAYIFELAVSLDNHKILTSFREFSLLN